SMTAMIRKLASGGYRLYSRKLNPRTGRRRNLGTFKSRAAAEKHERAVQYFRRHELGPHVSRMRCSVKRAARNGAPLIRDRSKHRAWNDPGSAAHHFASLVLRCARDTLLDHRRSWNVTSAPSMTAPPSTCS